MIMEKEKEPVSLAEVEKKLREKREQITTLSEEAQELEEELSERRQKLQELDDTIDNLESICSDLYGRAYRFITYIGQLEGHEGIGSSQLSKTLREALTRILKESDRPLKVKELVDKLPEVGYVTDSERPAAVVSNCLSRYDEFKRVRRGIYRLGDTEEAEEGEGRPQTLKEAVTRVMHEADGPLKVKDVKERVLEMGYITDSKHLSSPISGVLSNGRQFERVKRGVYRIVREDENREGQAGKANDNSKQEDTQ